MITTIPDRVGSAALTAPRLPAFIYDLRELAEHARAIRQALPHVEIFYAAKANPDPPILRTLAPYVDGFEISSGGELAHLREVLPEARLAFGGPGKTGEELELAVRSGVARIHVESPHELRRLAAFGREADILLRANLEVSSEGAALAMNGPFGMDEAGLAECAALLPRFPWIRLRGVHAHLASGLDAPAMAGLAARVLGWALPWLGDLPDPEVNVGGGMGVDYTRPSSRFDWPGYAALLGAPPARVRIEPGRAVTAYCGWYVTEVLDIKSIRGTAHAVLRGGTHHLRTPVAKGHDQPFAVLAGPSRQEAWQEAYSGPVTLVGQLCTPKDVFARQVEVARLRIGDLVAFAMAGAYGWNISHHDFLMHPKPAFHYLP